MVAHVSTNILKAFLAKHLCVEVFQNVLNVMKENNNVALLVHSCDRYQFLYKGFEFFFSKFWDFDVNCTCYFATEEAPANVRHFVNIKSGKGAWADRLSILLTQKIKEDYVVYMQEDMWLNKKINAAFFNQLFKLAKANNWQQVKLHSSDVYTTTPTGILIEGFSVALVDNEKSDFLMSHQITLWNKNFLLGQLGKNEHPWRNERKATSRMKKLNPAIYQVDYFAENGNAPINTNSNPVLRSEYQTISVNGTLNHNIQPFIDVLKNEDAGLQQYSAQLDFNYTHHLTHDGKPKPKKVDIFKRIKNFIQGK